jgi:hypothetical protein
MPSLRYRVCLPPTLGQQLEAVAEESGQAISGVIRRCVELALDSPELRLLLHQEGPPALADTSTLEQRQAWADYQERMQGFDLGTILAEHSRLQLWERGTSMPRSRTWSAERRNPGNSWGELTPIYTPQLSDHDILVKRWELAQETVQLILGDENENYTGVVRPG